MKKVSNIYTHRLMLLAVLVLTLALAACSSRHSDEPELPGASMPGQDPGGSNERCMMGFYVNLGIQSTSPREAHSRAAAPTGDGYQSGVGFENFVDVNDVRVYLFSEDDNLIACLSDPDIAELTNFDMSAIGTSGPSTLYQILFRVDRLIPDAADAPHTFKIVVLANWGTYPPLSSIYTINDLTAGENGLGEFDPTQPIDRIPLFGVQEYKDVEFDINDKKNLQPEPLFLLRAFAKVDVYDAATTESKIKGVKLVRYNTKYYKAPKGITHNDQYTGDAHYGYDFDFVTDLSLPESDPYLWENAEAVELQQQADGHFVIYIPEYKNVGREDADTRSKLVLDYDNGKDYIVDFAYYNNPPAGSQIGDPFDVRRNYWYKFVVKRTTVDLDITATVLPYLAVDLDPWFGMPQD